MRRLFQQWSRRIFLSDFDGSHGLIYVIHRMIHYALDFQWFTNYGLIQIRFGVTYSLFFLCTSNLKLQRRWSCKAFFDMLIQPTCTHPCTLMHSHVHTYINSIINHKGRLKGGDVKQNRIMSRTRNLITIARGTIAENARRQMSLLNQCRMPNPSKRDFRFMGHRI